MKKCSQCFRELELKMFKKRTKSKDGLKACCRDCHRGYDRRYQSSEKYKKTESEYRRLYRLTPKGKEVASGQMTKRVTKRDIKRLAREKLHTEVRCGRVQRGSCVVCGEPKAHGHHEDYTKPLEVIWLCRVHHEETHNKKRLMQSKLATREVSVGGGASNA